MQGWLFGRELPRIGSLDALERITLPDGAWLDLARGWLDGHARLYDELCATVAWRAEERRMYERIVDVPRLVATLAERPPIVEEMRRALDAHYDAAFSRVSAAWYRDGRDSVAWHGDYVARNLPEALVATVSLGGPRRFLVRPSGGGRSISLSLGCGDLIVMGGTCQRTHQHAVPKVTHAEPRIALMFRPVWET